MICAKCHLDKEITRRDRRCKDCYNAYARAYYKANKEKLLPVLIARNREWAKNHPSTIKANRHHQKARLRGAEGKHTIQDIRHLHAHQHGKCVYCSVDMGDKYEVDHIVPIKRGGRNSSDNLQLLCRSCNASKGAKLPEEFLSWRAAC